MREYSWWQPAWVTCACRTSLLTLLLCLWITAPPPPQQFWWIKFPSTKLISEKKNLITTPLWRWGQVEMEHFNAAKTRRNCATSAFMPHLTAVHPMTWRCTNCDFSQSWPTCPSFVFHSISNYIISCPRLSPTFVSTSLGSYEQWCHPPWWVKELGEVKIQIFFLLSRSGSRAHSLR